MNSPRFPDPESGNRPGVARPGRAKPGLDRLRAYRWLLLLATLVFLLDQATKAWITARIPYDPAGAGAGGTEVIAGFFYLIDVGNTGAAWSMFTGGSVVLAALAAATLVAIFLGRRALGLRDPVAQVGFGLLCGGIAGNLADRLRCGHVIDFVSLHFGTYIYPTFNVADSGICVGVACYLWHSLRQPKADR
jgi:signal peptidase II